MQLGLGFWASKTLLSAVELELFTELARHPGKLHEVQTRVGLHPRAARDFLDALVSMDLLRRDPDGTYRNSPQADAFLDKDKPGYVGGILEMANHRLYRFWGRLTEALRTGRRQNEDRQGHDFFAALYADPARLRQFLRAMTGLSRGPALAIARQIPWGRFTSFVDVGPAQGDLAVQIALKHRHLKGVGFDLPQVRPVFEQYVQENNLAARLSFVAGNFFTDPIPSADVVIMGHILHDWDLEQKLLLLQKAYEALPHDGVVVVYDAIIDDNRSKNTFGLLMSLNMLIETEGGFDYSGQQCQQWMRQVGFRDTRIEHLCGPDSMVVGIK